LPGFYLMKNKPFFSYFSKTFSIASKVIELYFLPTKKLIKVVSDETKRPIEIFSNSFGLNKSV